MVNYIKNNSTTGVYLTIDENNEIETDNTPGNIDLDNLVLGTGYIYFDDFLNLTETGTTPDTGVIFGWVFGQNDTTVLKTQGYTGSGVWVTYNVVVHVTATQQQNFLRFFEVHQGVANQMYLLRQTASETFKQFPYNTVLKKWAPVILVGYNLLETNQQGINVQTLSIQLVKAYRL